MKLRRTEKNDLVVGNNSKFSLQNILVITSMLFVLLFFIPVFRVEVAERSFSFANMTFGGGTGFGNNFFLFLLLIPAVNICLWVLNVKKHNAKHSFKFVMISYVLSLCMSIFVLMISRFFALLDKMSSMMSGFSGMGGGLGGSAPAFFSRNFFGVIYTVFAVVYLVTAITGIIFTGEKEVEKGLAAEDFFTKENFNKIKDVASKQVENAKQALDNKSESKSGADSASESPKQDKTETEPVTESLKEESSDRTN